jgi:hypothetical protein
MASRAPFGQKARLESACESESGDLPVPKVWGAEPTATAEMALSFMKSRRSIGPFP